MHGSGAEATNVRSGAKIASSIPPARPGRKWMASCSACFWIRADRFRYRNGQRGG